MLSNAQTGIRADQWTAAKEEAKATLTEVAATTEAMARPELSPLRVF
ncbi:MAG: hypothetical protein JOY71_16195 [Acetobacteraceae bacterium]|nr:hypothetical protein [Acetobacteraceae bacterium]MBV8523637.1 hypothetical protein [Acetobacteraceae bacterium]